MNQQEPVPIETSEGSRTSASFGERFVVALAAVALLGGGLIVLGNLLGGEEGGQVAGASPTPRASATPARTPRPSRTPRPPLEVTVQPLSETEMNAEPPEQLDYFHGLVRARRDLAVHAEPRREAPIVGTLPAGTLAAAAPVEVWHDGGAAANWIQLFDVALDGFVLLDDAAEGLFERIEAPEHWGAEVSALSGSPSGFLALVTAPAERSIHEPPRFAVSDDGERWQILDRGPTVGYHHYHAWGPAGWIMIEIRDTPSGPVPIVGRSAGGRSWEVLGSLAGIGHDYPAALVGSWQGYLLAMRAGLGLQFWWSSDGMRWHEGRAPTFSGGYAPRLAATHIGYYAWPDVVYEYFGTPDQAARLPPQGAFSLDGREWVLVEEGPGPLVIDVVSYRDSLLAFDFGPDGETRAWVGVVDGAQVHWRHDQAAEETFAGSGVAAVAGDGERVRAFGWALDTDQPLSWRYDGRGWEREELPAAIGGIPRQVAVGRDGFVVVGYRPTLAAANPVFWHETVDGWRAEAEPLLPLLGDPVGADCPPPPEDLIAFIRLPPSVGAACHGGDPITLRAWVIPCENCGWWTADHEPAWLASPDERQLLLTPIEGGQSAFSPTTVVLHPNVGGPAEEWAGRWIQLTGHFDDPEAQSCKLAPDVAPQGLARWFYQGRQQLVNYCRSVFVVTEIAAVDGP